MGKIRAKDVKVKKTNDFKKKTAKVGKKVERGNVTKISVTSKRIVIPIQAKITSDDSKDDSSKIDGLVRLLQHYNSKNRASALMELKDIFEKSSNSKRFVGMYILLSIINNKIACIRNYASPCS